MAARAGDERAWAQLYRELAPVVLGYLRARGAPDADDLLGEVFVQAVRDLPRFEGSEQDLRAWLLAIAHNRLADELRRRGRRPVDPMSPEAVPEPEPAASAEREALERIGADEVRRLTSLLSPDQQAVILLRILGGLTVGEIARVLGKREGAVKALQRRGLARIRRELRRPDSAPGPSGEGGRDP
jgi:RNA polymerase sigma-70 factor (ECF subfamily)